MHCCHGAKYFEPRFCRLQFCSCCILCCAASTTPEITLSHTVDPRDSGDIDRLWIPTTLATKANTHQPIHIKGSLVISDPGECLLDSFRCDCLVSTIGVDDGCQWRQQIHP